MNKTETRKKILQDIDTLAGQMALEDITVRCSLFNKGNSIHVMFEFQGTRIANYYPQTGSYHVPGQQTRKIPALTEAAQEVRQHIEAHTVNCCGKLLLIA
jgi:hypothetical protein